ncbi:Spy0128 family protein [Gemella morbillorum]
MKNITKKYVHVFMAVLLVLSVFIPFLKTENTAKAAELPANKYNMTATVKINNNPIVDNAKYGEGKFYISPTYTFPDDVVLQNGDYMVYQVPNEFKIEQDSTTDLSAADGTVIAKLTTNKAANTATVTVTNQDYFAKMPEGKKITALFTVVWADSVVKDKPYNITFPGAGNYTLTRIVPDDDPTGFTKWGVQDSNDPNYVNWRIRINRYAKQLTNVNIADTIPEGQVLASDITGYYFTGWNKPEAHPKLDAAHVTVTDQNHFSINPNGNGKLDGQGLYILYKTRLTAPVDNTTKKVFNNAKVTTDQGVFDVPGFAPLTTTEGIGAGGKSDEVVFEVTKKLEGKALEADAFTFQLIAPDGTVQEAKNDAKGKVKFPAVKFSKTGTFNYQIKEVDGKKGGYTYDTKTINATVTVTDVYGVKTASVKYDNKEFKNTYKAAETTVQLEATKVLKNKVLEAEKYEFELKENGALVSTAKNDAAGKITFPVITYTEAGEHTYTITEKAGSGDDGVAYDPNAYEVTVDVKDNGEGKLVATVTGLDNLTFVNVYTAKPTKATITATKALNGSTLKDDQFEFELKEGAKVVGTAKNKADGTITFEDITYTEAGVHTYTLTEKEGTEGGVTYDKTSHEVKVEVTDNGQGKLVAAVTGNNPAFTNTYKAAETKATITATKVLSGSTLKDDQFEFELKEGAKVVGTAKNKADGTVTFEDITYTEAGVHTYTLTEKEGTEGGVTYDKTSHDIKVEVTDNGQGKLVAAVTGNNPTFTNTYKAAETTATITAKKVLEGKALEADKYEFELKEGAKVVGTAKNKADGTITFEDITYTEVGEHEYTVTEKSGNEAGVTYDSKSYTVKVKVTDNGQGKLVAAVTDNNPTFTNTYKAAATKATIKAKKVLKDKDLKENQFEFELKEGTKAVGTAKNKADGSIAFDVEYTKAGEYEYTLTEKAGDEADIEYDKEKYTVKVTVTDKGGQLEAKVTGDNVTFINKYNKPTTETPDKPNDSEPKKELPNTGATDSPLFPSLLGLVLAALSIFLYRTKDAR